jgi:hypothetical protein
MPELSPARALLIPDQELPSEELTIPLSDKDVQTFQIIQRWRDGESLLSLSQELQLTKEGLRRRIKSLAYKYSGSDRLYQELVREVLVNKLIDDEENLESAETQVAAARGREMLKHAEWLAERLMPDRFAPKREVRQDTTVRVVVERRKPLVIKDIDTQTR